MQTPGVFELILNYWTSFFNLCYRQPFNSPALSLISTSPQIHIPHPRLIRLGQIMSNSEHSTFSSVCFRSTRSEDYNNCIHAAVNSSDSKNCGLQTFLRHLRASTKSQILWPLFLRGNLFIAHYLCAHLSVVFVCFASIIFLLLSNIH